MIGGRAPLLLATVGVLSLNTGPAIAQATPGLFEAKTLRCSFTVSVTGNMGGDKPRVEQNTDSLESIFDTIDLKAGTARLIGNLGGYDVTVLKAGDAIYFIEAVGAGHMQLTVVYTAPTTTGRFKAAYSRHASILGHPLPSQWYGSCRAL